VRIRNVSFSSINEMGVILFLKSTGELINESEWVNIMKTYGSNTDQNKEAKVEAEDSRSLIRTSLK
jgi:hypothetical protein